MSLQIIPLSSRPRQQLSVQLQVDGQPLTLQLLVSYNELAGYWILRISNSSGKIILDSIPMITGEYPMSNMLAQYGYLKIGSAYILNNSGTQDENANYNTLGTDFILAWDDTAL